MNVWRVRDAKIVSEIIDGEAIIMDLNTGIYFSASGAGAFIWDGILAGFDDTQIEQRIIAAFDVQLEQLRPDFQAFLVSVLANNLAVAGNPSGASSDGWTVELPAARLDYSPPFLVRYGDMEDLALLDPIHDVEETEGWPARKLAEDHDWPSPGPHG